MSKIFVTGANGSIGSALVASLEREGNQVVVQQNRSLRVEDPAYFEQIQNPDELDTLYHLAAVSFVPLSWEEPSRFIQINVQGTSNALEFCRKHQIKFIYISSYAYGAPHYLPIDEKHPVSAVNPYGLSKIMGEELCTFYGKNFNLPYLIVRPFNVYGTMKNKALLIPEIIQQIIDGKVIKVKDLAPKRDYVFIDDLISFLVKAKEHITNEIYNVGSGESHSVAEIIAVCQEVWGTNLEVHSEQTERKNEISETRSDISKAKTNINWSPQFSLKDGIQKIKDSL